MDGPEEVAIRIVAGLGAGLLVRMAGMQLRATSPMSMSVDGHHSFGTHVDDNVDGQDGGDDDDAELDTLADELADQLLPTTTPPA